MVVAAMSMPFWVGWTEAIGEVGREVGLGWRGKNITVLIFFQFIQVLEYESV